MAKENTEKDLSTIYSELDSNKLVLPNFQRGFVWDRNKQKSLLASLLVDLPVGSLLILNGDTEDFSKRRICYPSEYTVEGSSSCEYVLDGQQRLSSLRSMFYDLFENDWLGVWKDIYGELRTRWFIRISFKDDSTGEENDYFGLRELDFGSLEHLTDGDIEGNIEYKPIHKTKTKDAHHPDYKPDLGSTSITKARIKNTKAELFAKEGLVPLWEVTKGKSGIHRKVLDKIAKTRTNELKIDAEEEGYSAGVYCKYFKPIDLSFDEVEIILEEKLDASGILDSTAFVDEWAKLEARWVERVASALEEMPKRKMAIIELSRNEVNRAVAIFEAINRGGAPLSVYDLVVAKSAQEKSEKNLSAKIIDSMSEGIVVSTTLTQKYIIETSGGDEGCSEVNWAPDVLGVIDGNEPSKILKEWFVNVLSVVSYSKYKNEPLQVAHIKKDKILSLKSGEVNQYSDKAIKAIMRALAFLQFRCGVKSSQEVPYRLMVVVLAYVLESDEIWKSSVSLNKIEYWYWSCLFGGAYLKSQNDRCIKDIDALILFIKNTDKNEFKIFADRVLNVQDYVSKDILLRKDDAVEKEPTSIKQGILQFILSNNPVDFTILEDGVNAENLAAWKISTGQQEVEIHHVIPLANKVNIRESTSELRKDPKIILNSTLNLAYITKKANRDISDTSPVVYIKSLEKMAAHTHYLPSDLSVLSDVSADDKTKENNYESVLSSRYDLIRNAISNKLNGLI